MIANYGYIDGTGIYYLTIDTDKCDGCGECVSACPNNMLETFVDDFDKTVVGVKNGVINTIGYVCVACGSPSRETPYPCHQLCTRGAFSHSW